MEETIFERIKDKIILASIIIVLGSIALYIILPKYHFVTYESIPLFRCNAITGTIDTVKIEQNKIIITSYKHEYPR